MTEIAHSGTAAAANPVLRWQGPVRIASLIGIAAGLLMVARTLPVETVAERLQAWVETLGLWGPLVYGVAYVLAALLFVPGAALTLGAGALFGLFWGTVTVSLASTTAAALAFLIARHLARGAVGQHAARYPRFSAVDAAIAEGGWKIVALLRLVPAFPFSMGNYLLGLTAVRFWPYVMASWAAMLPGTFVYVYFGHLGRAGFEDAATGQPRRGTLEWALLGAGIVAALLLVAYLTRLARRALGRSARVAAAPSVTPQDAADIAPAARPRSSRTVVLAGLAAAALVAGTGAQLNPTWWRDLAGGPPAVTSVEQPAAETATASFDHSAFDALLRRHVDDQGLVDYAGLGAARAELRAYLAQLAAADMTALGRDERLALLINAYNASTLELILEHFNGGALRSIKDIPSSKRWEDVRWRIGANTWSLNQIEHEQIRPHFREPRVHWALVCAAMGCPPLRNEAYAAARLDEQLEDQARRVHAGDRWFGLDRERGVVQLTRIYDWYHGDFEQIDGSVLAHASRFAPLLRELIEQGRAPRVRYLDYDWSLNRREGPP